MYSLWRNSVLGLIGLTLVLHNAEEYLTFPWFLDRVGARLPAWFPASRLAHPSQGLPIALLLATVLPLLAIAVAIITGRKPLLIAALFIEAVLPWRTCLRHCCWAAMFPD